MANYTGKYFPHEIHVNRASPDYNIRNQIDYIYINKKFRRTLLDVRVKRGTNVASDHELVVGKRYGDNNTRTKFNVDRLKYSKDQFRYQRTLSEKNGKNTSNNF